MLKAKLLFDHSLLELLLKSKVFLFGFFPLKLRSENRESFEACIVLQKCSQGLLR